MGIVEMVQEKDLTCTLEVDLTKLSERMDMRVNERGGNKNDAGKFWPRQLVR